MAKKSVRPTDAELAILRVLWSRGPSTVRQTHKALADERETTYNTTLKFMQIMLEKGSLHRDDSVRPQVYSAAIPEEQMQQRLTKDFLARVFGGSARKLMAALVSEEIPAEEMVEIRRLLNEHRGKKP
jgi:BlaI family transcriptional regulator, penicillinase repressor